MAEYIDKEQLLSELYSKQDEPLDIMKEIVEFPAADVVLVVRCRDCRWGQRDDIGVMHCHKYHCHKETYGFCDEGEQREDSHD